MGYSNGTSPHLQPAQSGSQSVGGGYLSRTSSGDSNGSAAGMLRGGQVGLPWSLSYHFQATDEPVLSLLSPYHEDTVLPSTLHRHPHHAHHLLSNHPISVLETRTSIHETQTSVHPQSTPREDMRKALPRSVG